MKDRRKEGFFTFAQAGEVLNRTRSGIEHLVSDGKLVAVKREGHNYVSAGSLERLKPTEEGRIPRSTREEREQATRDRLAVKREERTKREALATELQELNAWEAMRERANTKAEAELSARREREAAEETELARVTREVDLLIAGYGQAGVTLDEGLALLGISNRYDFRERVRTGELRELPKPTPPELRPVTAMGRYSLGRMQLETQCSRLRYLEARYVREDVLALRARLETTAREKPAAKEPEFDALGTLLKLAAAAGAVKLAQSDFAKRELAKFIASKTQD